jgi:hypothetical protein
MNRRSPDTFGFMLFNLGHGRNPEYRLDVLFGSEADICSAKRHVRFPQKQTCGAKGMFGLGQKRTFGAAKPITKIRYI